MQDNNSPQPNSDPKGEELSIKSAVSNNTKILALFAIACTIAVGLVNLLTEDTIKHQQQQYLLNTLHTIIAPSRYDNDIANDCVVLSAPELGSNKVHKAYVARKSDKVVAVALTSTATEGYSGDIDFIIAINKDSTISGVRVLKHQETPGLGDKIELRKSNWINSFNGKQMFSENDKRWAVTKDNGMFDQFTGATITPRALVAGIKNTLNYFNQHHAQFLQQSNACATDNNDDNHSSDITESDAINTTRFSSNTKNTLASHKNMTTKATNQLPYVAILLKHKSSAKVLYSTEVYHG